jgi:nucleotide-binding universal stress UspA family protein
VLFQAAPPIWCRQVGLDDFPPRARRRHCAGLDGRVVPEILREAEALPADLIVIGTHGRSGFDRLVLGSVAEKVLRKAECPVLTVPPIGPAAVDATAPFKSILCAVDFSIMSQQALNAAVELANRFGSTLIVLHVSDWAFGDEHMDRMPAAIIDLGRNLKEQAGRQLREFAAGVRAERPPVELVALGRPAREIVHVALEYAADLIVMGIAGRGAVDLALMGSIANHVVRESPCPVLTVRAPGRRGLSPGRDRGAAAHCLM